MENSKLFHFLRGLTSPSPEKWSSHFSKLVRQIAKLALMRENGSSVLSKKTFVQRELTIEGTLGMLEPYVKRQTFKNPPEELNRARVDLLHLWDSLIEILLTTTTTSLQTKAYRLIFSIMTRKEFSLVHVDFTKPSLSAKFKLYKMETIQEYQKLLVTTLQYITESISLKNGNLVETLQFCSNVLAVNFFRFESVQQIVLNALLKKKEKNEAAASIFDKRKRNSVIKTLKARQTISTLKKSLFADHDSKGQCQHSSQQTSGLGNISSPVLTPVQETPLQPIFERESEEVTSTLPSLDRSSRARVSTRESSNGNKFLGHTRGGTRFFFRSLLKVGHKRKDPSNGTPLMSTSFAEQSPDLFLWWHLTRNGPAQKELDSFLKFGSHPYPECVSWLESKETFYITFLNSFVTYVNTISPGKVEWRQVSGFDILLDCFWPLLKSYFVWQNTAEMQPERAVGFIRTTTASNYVENCYKLLLLSDPSFVNDLIYLCLCETNVLSYRSVVVSLDKIKTFIETVGGWHFNIEIYWFGISSCIKQENLNVTRKVILHLYSTLMLLKGEERLAFCIHLFQKYFYKLFLHWSSEVRLLFQALLVFKTFHADRRKLPFTTDALLFNSIEASQPKKFNCTVPVLGQRVETKEEDKNAEISQEERVVDNKVAILLDTMIMNCLALQRGEEDAVDVPLNLKVYLSNALHTYAQILGKFYNGEPHDSTMQILKALLSLIEANGGVQHLDGKEIG